MSVIYDRVYSAAYTCDRNQPISEERSPGGLTVLSVGRLVSPKYQECLIRAVQGLDIKLVLIGDGFKRQFLEQVVQQLDMAEQVQFIKSVPNSEIPRYYREADIFAIATHYEGFCIPVLEAMASGLPVVASRIGPIEEVLGGTGVLVENRPEAFATALVKLGKDPLLRRELGERARSRALELDGCSTEGQ